jgi:hypothetical protein
MKKISLNSSVSMIGQNEEGNIFEIADIYNHNKIQVLSFKLFFVNGVIYKSLDSI